MTIENKNRLNLIEEYRVGQNPSISVVDHLNENCKESTIQQINVANVYYDRTFKIMWWDAENDPLITRGDFFTKPESTRFETHWNETIQPGEVYLRGASGNFFKRHQTRTTKEGLLDNLESIIDTILVFHQNEGEEILDSDHIDEGYNQYSDHYDWLGCLEAIAIEPPRISSTIGLDKINSESVFDHIDEVTLCCGWGGPNLYLSFYVKPCGEHVWKFTGKWEESLIIKGNFQIAEAINRDMQEVNTALDAFSSYLLQIIQDHK